MFLGRAWQRLGDCAAGTLAVRDRRLEAPTALATVGGPDWREALGQIERVSAKEYRVVREFLRRRAELDRNRRQDLACGTADPLAEKLGRRLGAGGEVRERFLEAAAYRERFG